MNLIQQKRFYGLRVSSNTGLIGLLYPLATGMSSFVVLALLYLLGFKGNGVTTPNLLRKGWLFANLTRSEVMAAKHSWNILIVPQDNKATA